LAERAIIGTGRQVQRRDLVTPDMFDICRAQLGCEDGLVGDDAAKRRV
jgi:hypothetical protein